MSKRRDPESGIWEIKRKTRRKYSFKEKTRIVQEGLQDLPWDVCTTSMESGRRISVSH